MVRRGSIVTFYSYKGGSGRTFILASVAVVLAGWGRRVLCVDWDLEAPGLSHYFARWAPTGSGGVVDMTEAIMGAGAGGRLDWSRHLTTVDVPGAGAIDLIPAGSAVDYISRVQAIDWGKLYAEHQYGEHLERFRAEVLEEYDVVLVDSRTGITDAGGICTVQLPDLLAMVFTANDQAIEGTLRVGERVRAARNRLIYDRTALPMVPILSRFDGREERELAKRWMGRAGRSLAPLYTPWIPEGVEVSSVLERTLVPYFSYWSFGEAIPTAEEPGTSPETISWSLETIAALLANGLGDVKTLVANRDQFVSSARLRSDLKYDVFLSFAQRDKELARSLAAALEEQGLLVYDPGGQGAGEGWATELERALGSSRHFVVVLRGGLNRTQELELRQFLIGLVDRETPSLVLVLNGSGGTPVPPALATFPALPIKDTPEATAEELARRLRSSEASAGLGPEIPSLESLSRSATLIRHAGPVRSVAWSPDGSLLASASDDGTVRLWEARSGAPLATLTGHTSRVYSVAWSPDGYRLAGGSWDRTLRLWEAEFGAPLATLTGHTGRVYSVAWSPDGARLASGSWDRTLRLWDAESGAYLATLTGHTGRVLAVAWSPDSNRLASGSSDGSVRLWDAKARADFATLTGHTGRVLAVAWSPDGSWLASASDDKTVCLWDAESGAYLATLTGHTGPVLAVSWSPDGSWLASASDDKTVRLWDAESRADFATLTGHAGPVLAVAWSPHGSRLVSGSSDGTVRLWGARSGG